jgi:sRNA-binding protein
LIQKYGVSNPEKTITWLEGYFGKEIGKLTEEETKEARAILDEKKRQRDEEKRQSRLQRLDDEDIPFPMGDK